MNQIQQTQIKDLCIPGLKIRISIMVSCCFLFMSCARYYYAPNSVNIPLLSEKEAKVNAQYATGTVSKGFELQSAFAITPHFGGMINTMIGGSKDDDNDFGSGKTNTSYIDIGAGYFTPIHSSSIIFETYAGIGTGGARNDYAPGRSNVTFTKLFIQPNIGVKVKGFEFGLSSRFNWINQHIVSRPYSNTTSEHHLADLDYISDHPVSFLWEPGAVLRIGGEKFMVQMQYTSSVNLTHAEDQFSQELGYFTIGFSVPIHYKPTGQ